MTCIDAAKAPAIQLQEHAKAVLKDDAARGIRREDKFLKALAKGDAHHSVAW